MPSELDQLLLGPNYQVGCLHLSPTIGSMLFDVNYRMVVNMSIGYIITSHAVNSKRYAPVLVQIRLCMWMF